MDAPADLHRRTMLRSAAFGTVAIPLLAACGDDGDTTGTTTPTADTPTSTPAASSPGVTKTPDGSGDAEVLASTSDVEVGGALFLEGVVITQPKAGEFHAFDRTCSHKQCPVTDVRDGKIHCSCHGSLYDLTTGDNVGGPAPSPLTKIDIAVQGTDIVATS